MHESLLHLHAFAPVSAVAPYIFERSFAQCLSPRYAVRKAVQRDRDGKVCRDNSKEVLYRAVATDEHCLTAWLLLPAVWFLAIFGLMAFLSAIEALAPGFLKQG